jgi:hypothetical protein
MKKALENQNNDSIWKTIVTALVIAQAGDTIMEMLLQGTHCRQGYHSAHWQVLHWCNVADIEKAGSGPSAECTPVPEKWNSQ